MKITRHFTTNLKPVEDQIEWKLVRASIPGANFEMDVEVPKPWSATATNILAQKYLRKAGVPQKQDLGPLNESNYDLPVWLKASHIIRRDHTTVEESETSAKQVFHRLAGHWTYIGWKHGYFGSSYTDRSKNIIPKILTALTEQNACAFYDEIYFMLAMQMAAPNSPQFFNTGLFWAYGITGPDSGQWAINYDIKAGIVGPIRVQGSYEFPQPHACFIQPVEDDLVNSGGIMDLIVREARLFKHGSGTGTNFSNVRSVGEKLGGGGTSSGLMSFLMVGDVAAGAIKSGGTTRRAAKMVCLDLDHPEIELFVNWKVREEAKAAAMAVGSHILTHPQKYGEVEYTPQAIRDRFNNNIEMDEFSCDWEGEAIRTVSGQNSNNSVRVTDDFLHTVDVDGFWNLTSRTTGAAVKQLRSRDLWNQICRAAWASADPGVQFDDTINAWNTCAADGKINASNPCGEYNFLDNTACNLASLNLVKFLQPDGTFDVKSFTYAARLWTIVLDISVSMASFPSREIALGSYNYRTLGLGYANVGGLLMRSGVAYDSDIGRDQIAAITALMHGVTFKTSAELAAELGSFPRWEHNKESMDRVLHKHLDHIPPKSKCSGIWKDARDIWFNIDPDAPYRNAQTTLIAPTGTIALLMDCDTTGIEPEFALKKTKLMAAGGTIQTINSCIWDGLTRLGYKGHETNLISNYLTVHGHLEGCPDLKPEHLAVFDCAMPPSGSRRCLSPMAHVLMVAAAQPFLSGAVSKTVNLPNTATVSDVDQIYREAHRLGIKSIALYRDGSKLTQPLSAEKTNVPTIGTTPQDTILSQKTRTPVQETSAKILREMSTATPDAYNNEDSESRQSENVLSRRRISMENPDARPAPELPDLVQPSGEPTRDPSDSDISAGTITPDDLPNYISSNLEENGSFLLLNTGELEEIISKVDTYVNEPGFGRPTGRRRLPAKRRGYTQKVKIDGQSLHLRTGEYLDGTLGEIWLDFSRNGSTLGGILSSFAKAVSIGLQYGVPLGEFVNSFVHTKFEPAGMVLDHDRIKMTSSLIDFVMRDLAIAYLGAGEYANTTSEEQGERDFAEHGTEDFNAVLNYKSPWSPPSIEKIADLLDEGYKPSGETCSTCGGQLVQSGTCKVCTSCGTSSGGCG